MTTDQPLVTVLTPVYNGAKYLSQCIESVLAQDYPYWEYVIVDNCSTDETLEIAQRFAAQDDRIRVHRNADFTDVITNHNIAFDQISPSSSFTKLLQADDWMFPRCISHMIRLAEEHPKVGVIGAYSLAGRRIRCDGLPYPSPQVCGREIARHTLLGRYYLFWSPSSLMLRSEVIRSQTPFFQVKDLHADVDALFRTLQEWDFGFAHEVLTFIREHEDSATAQDARKTNAQRLSHLALLLRYGPVYLTDAESKRRLAQLTEKYYESLVRAAFELRDRSFWTFQRREAKRLGLGLSYSRLLGAMASELACHPRRSMRRLKHAAMDRYRSSQAL